ncbi:MAG: hypothetical protein IPM90_10930 [Austwickia sp.]|nr:hypothetical protein [Austwickia sp.]
MPTKRPQNNRIVTAAAAVVAGGSLAIAGFSLANANSAQLPTTLPTTVQATGADGAAGTTEGPRGFGRHAHTAVTGDEAAKVTAAVKAKDAAVTVGKVLKDPDGSYDVLGTKAGAPVMVEVSADLKTLEVRTGGPGRGMRGGPHGPGRHAHTAVTGNEAAKVTAAVKAKDAAVTVGKVLRDPDGSYDVLGTKAGAPVMVEVSSDLKTIEVRTGGPGHGMRGGKDRHFGAQEPVSATTTAPSTQGAAYTASV